MSNQVQDHNIPASTASASPPASRPTLPVPTPQDHDLIQELIDEFRRIPDEWKPDVLQQVRTFVRLSTLPTHRFIADDPPNPDPGPNQ